MRPDRRPTCSEKQNAFSGSTADLDTTDLKSREHRVDAGTTSLGHSGRQIMDAWDRPNGGGAGRIVFGFLDADNDRAALRVGKGHNLVEQLVASNWREIRSCRPRIRAVPLPWKLLLEL